MDKELGNIISIQFTAEEVTCLLAAAAKCRRIIENVDCVKGKVRIFYSDNIVLNSEKIVGFAISASMPPT